MTKPAGLRAVGVVLKDVRSAIVAAIVLAAISGGSVVLHDHVRVRAWTVVAAGAAMLLATLGLYWLSYRAALKAVHLEGALDEARQRAAKAETAQRLDPTAEETLRLIAGLHSTLQRHAAPYGVATTVDASSDEILRSRDIVSRVRVLVGAMDSGTSDLLTHFANPTERGPPSVGALLSGLDHMTAMVTNWGLRDEGSIPAPSPSGVDVITTPTHTVVVDQRPQRP